ncbi:hypothetical protein N7471_003998 [Penicillium samsonianum]|uniref:uncharacterized protein n=1 Tax=Penicillium samsonianum TaxID=1882272 RepID=UPI002547CDE1|nr:uncharacterized protein N7471_003998 [Penicillium samsonianum]KAJ6137512.1 hypothetical protein N7471_003998 [Penicillium samsonianum]
MTLENPESPASYLARNPQASESPVPISVSNFRGQRRLFLTDSTEPARPSLTAGNVILHTQNIFTISGNFITTGLVFARNVRNRWTSPKAVILN